MFTVVTSSPSFSEMNSDNQYDNNISNTVPGQVNYNFENTYNNQYGNHSQYWILGNFVIRTLVMFNCNCVHRLVCLRLYCSAICIGWILFSTNFFFYFFKLILKFCKIRDRSINYITSKENLIINALHSHIF